MPEPKSHGKPVEVKAMDEETQTTMDVPEAHTPHPPHTGHRWIDILLGLVAVLVSGISLFVAIEHGHTMEKLVAANSWPNLQADVTVKKGDTDGSVRLAIDISNSGVGPARLETLQIWNEAGPVTDADGLGKWIKQLGGGAPLAAQVDGGQVVGEVIGARQSNMLIALTVADGNAWRLPIIKAAGALETRICYCSVFDDCYVSDTRKRDGRPEEVKICPKPETPYNDDIADVLLRQTATPPLPTSTPKAS